MQETLKKEAMDSMAERLSAVENLYFPRAVQSNAVNPSQRKSLLLDLLSRDAAVFLERYGSQLTFEELQEFDMLNNDYEINWHLKNLRSKDQTARGMARPGERWSETLMRRCEEAILVSKIRDEQQRLGVAESEWVGQPTRQVEEQEEEEEEEETEEEEEEEEDENEKEAVREIHDVVNSNEVSDDANGGQLSREQENEEATTSLEEKEDMMNQFTYIMHQKFLSGEDSQHLDYSKIDDDETLDDHWLREANLDAEDKYFAMDEDD
ncbi:hypothetical protein M5689_002972 [Euphorbia peplus]|nr:hypothetical protein M5689_002972 [Euphorbia peplus]